MDVSSAGLSDFEAVVSPETASDELTTLTEFTGRLTALGFATSSTTGALNRVSGEGESGITGSTAWSAARNSTPLGSAVEDEDVATAASDGDELIC